MPDKETIEKVLRDKREGKSPSTQAGEFVKNEIEEIRRGEHGARSTKQAIAIGLSEARRAGVDLPPPKKGKVKESTAKALNTPTRSDRASVNPNDARRFSNTSRRTQRHMWRSRGRPGKRRPAAAQRSAGAKKAAETKGGFRPICCRAEGCQNKGIRRQKTSSA
jgi:hypothetical protein